AMDLGGADWGVAGYPIEYFHKQFSNAMGSNRVARRITLEGYNYDQLYSYATQLTGMMTNVPRIGDPLIVGAPSNYITQRPAKEFYVDFDEERMAENGLTMDRLYSKFDEWSFRKPVLTTFFEGQMQSVWMVSDRMDDFRIWDFINTGFDVDNVQYKMAGLARIDSRLTGNAIYKINQQYRLGVSYDFTGSQRLEESIRDRLVKQINDVLP